MDEVTWCVTHGESSQCAECFREQLKAENARQQKVLQWIASMDVEPWSIDTVQEVVEMAKEAQG